MRWVDAATIPAKMVYCQPRLNWTHEPFICKAMGQTVPLAVIPDLPIPNWNPITQPFPTPPIAHRHLLSPPNYSRMTRLSLVDTFGHSPVRSPKYYKPERALGENLASYPVGQTTHGGRRDTRLAPPPRSPPRPRRGCPTRNLLWDGLPALRGRDWYKVGGRHRPGRAGVRVGDHRR